MGNGSFRVEVKHCTCACTGSAASACHSLTTTRVINCLRSISILSRSFHCLLLPCSKYRLDLCPLLETHTLLHLTIILSISTASCILSLYFFSVFPSLPSLLSYPFPFCVRITSVQHASSSSKTRPAGRRGGLWHYQHCCFLRPSSRRD